MDPGTAERIDAHADLRAANGVHIDHIGEVSDVGAEIVVPVRRGGVKGLFESDPLQTQKVILEKLVCLRLDPGGDIRFRRSAVRGIVFESAVMWRIVGGRDHDPVGKSRLSPAIVCQNCMGDGRRWRVFIPLRQHDFHAVCGQYFKRAGKRGHRQGMGVHAQEERTIDFLLGTVQADGLTDGENMPLVEGLLERRAAMSRRPEGNPFR